MRDDSRVEVAMASLDMRGKHAWLNACVIPRPIAWVSTVSAAGQRNLAPHSYFTVASVDPPVLAFTSVGAKDTLRNIRETGEFVVSITTHALAEQVNHTSARFDPDVDELAEAGLTALPFAGVAPVGVAQAPVAMQCRAIAERAFGQTPSAAVMVFGEVLAVSVAREILAPDGMPDPAAVDAVSRLGREQWSRQGAVFTLPRPD